MTTIQKLEYILNAYRQAVLNVKGTYEEKIGQLIDLSMCSGVCFFSEPKGFELPEYIIKRNVNKHLYPFYYWDFSPSQYFRRNQDPMEGIITRIIILEKELKHYRKWRFLAKYIKP
jgi:hypothetical protein